MSQALSYNESLLYMVLCIKHWENYTNAQVFGKLEKTLEYSSLLKITNILSFSLN